MDHSDLQDAEVAGRSVPMRSLLRSLGFGIVMGLAVACAKARVQNVQADQSTALARPGRVVVFDFDTGGHDVRMAQSRDSATKPTVGLSVDGADVLAEAVADALASRVVEDVRALGLTAERAVGASPPALNDVVIQGQFLRIDEGSAVKRLVIGFGAGATELRTQVEMFQVTARGWRPIVQFDTVARGAKFPGAAFSVVGGAATGAVATAAVVGTGGGVIREMRASIDADARRTSEQIAKKVAEVKSRQRW